MRDNLLKDNSVLIYSPSCWWKDPNLLSIFEFSAALAASISSFLALAVVELSPQVTFSPLAAAPSPANSFEYNTICVQFSEKCGGEHELAPASMPTANPRWRKVTLSFVVPRMLACSPSEEVSQAGLCFEDSNHVIQDVFGVFRDLDYGRRTVWSRSFRLFFFFFYNLKHVPHPRQFL